MKPILLNPVSTPYVKSRSEAWKAFYASLLGQRNKHQAASVSFQKEFKKALKSYEVYKLDYFIRGYRPNRGQILLKRLTGEEIWHNLVNNVTLPQRDLHLEYEVNPVHEFYHTRQMKLNLMPWWDRRLFNEGFYPFEEGYEEQTDLPTPMWAHYVDVYNDFIVNGNHNDPSSIQKAGTVVMQINLAARMHYVDLMAIHILTLGIQRAASHLSKDDCFTLIALAMGYTSAKEAYNHFDNLVLNNRHFQQPSE